MPKSSTPWLEAWYAALRSPAGVSFLTEDFETARQRLYAARREADDPQLASLTITSSPTDPSRLWIVHNGKAAPDAP